MTDRTPELPPQTKDKGEPRTIQQALHDAIKRLEPEEQKRVRAILHDKGVLKPDEPGRK